MKHLLVAAALLAMPVSPVLAADARLASRTYNPDEIVRIDGKLNVQATITFGEGESIENVAVGDSESWQITPNKRADLLFVKPLAENARTNMTVVTDRHTYYFDLVAAPAAKPVYALRFVYADPVRPVVAEAAPAEPVTPADNPPSAQPSRPAVATGRQSTRKSQEPPETRPKPASGPEHGKSDSIRIEPEKPAAPDAPGDFDRLEAARRDVLAERTAATNGGAESGKGQPGRPVGKPAEVPRSVWQMRGATGLFPTAVHDDGEVTYLDWPSSAALPELFDVGGSGNERPLSFSREGETVVIAAVPRRIVLRSGQETAWLDRSGKRNSKKKPAGPVGNGPS